MFWRGLVLRFPLYSPPLRMQGFASFMEMYASNHIFPDWQMWGQFTIGMRMRK